MSARRDDKFEHLSELEMLTPAIQKWVRAKKWTEFRDIQRTAIQTLSTGDRTNDDLILCAPTAGGKTAAALLPLLSRISRAPGSPSFEIMLISPLRALIRQQADEDGDVANLAAAADGRKVHPWMGDISVTVKNRSWDSPNGILLITPESLESMFIHRAREMPERFSQLTAIVIDELHAYFDSPRGTQLISLLARLDTRLQRKTPVQRIALSATLGDGSPQTIDSLYRFLRPSSSPQPRTPTEHSKQRAGEALLDIHLIAELEKQQPVSEAMRAAHAPTPAQARIVEHLRSVFDAGQKQKKGLIFTNSRHDAEDYARWCEGDSAGAVSSYSEPPEEEESSAEEAELESSRSDQMQLQTDGKHDSRRFRPHHGSLNKKAREAAEARMRNPELASTLVCTTTLELGIDVGAIEEVAQIGPSPTVASLRQRMGRSGRLASLVPRGHVSPTKKAQQPRLHVFLREPSLDDTSSPLDRLRLPVFQTLAQIELLRDKRFETPNASRIDLSTLVQQLLSIIYEHREEGITLGKARAVLTTSGPFRGTLEALYREDARSIFDATIHRLSSRRPALIDVDHIDGVEGDDVEIFLTPEGERLINAHLVYTAFRTPLEYTIRSSTGVIASAPLTGGFSVGENICIGGRAYEVAEVSHTKRVVYVRPASAGRALHFRGEAIPVSQAVIEQMKDLYLAPEKNFNKRLEELGTTNPDVRRLAKEGRETFSREGLATSIVPLDYTSTDLWVLPWLGIRRMNALYLLLRSARLPVMRNGLALIILDRSTNQVAEAIIGAGLLQTENRSWTDMMDLVRFAGGVSTGKFDHYLNPTLRRADFARSQVELNGVIDCLKALASPPRSSQKAKAR